jgi:hypothetical protein
MLQAQSGQPIPVLQKPRPGYSFPVRQTLTYAVDWRVFPAGTAVLHLEQDGNTERVMATADSIGTVNLLYRVTDRFQSWFDRTTGCSSGFNKQTAEGRRQVSAELAFDYAHATSRLDEKNLVTGTSKHQEAQIPPCVTDLLSGVFYAASQPIQVGQSFQMPVGDAIHTVAVTMKAEGREEVKTPTGTYQTIRVQPTAAAGVVKNRGAIWIWYTDDDRHLPVQMRARLFWGTITFRLTSVEQK